MSKYEQKQLSKCECDKSKSHSLEVRSQLDVETILREAEKGKRTHYFPKESFGGKFNVTIELSDKAENPEITEEVCRILKEEFLKDFLKKSGQEKNSALTSVHILDKGEEVQC